MDIAWLRMVAGDDEEGRMRAFSEIGGFENIGTFHNGSRWDVVLIREFGILVFCLFGWIV